MIRTLAILVAAGVAGCAAGEGGMKKSSTGTLRHVVVFKFKEGAPPDAVRTIEEKFRALKDRVPNIVAFEWGTNVSPENLNQGFTHCFLVSFPDAAARDAYLVHPAHQEFVTLLRPNLEKAFVVDYVARD